MPIDTPGDTPTDPGDGGGTPPTGGGGTTPPVCDLVLLSAMPTAPTSAGGFGFVTITYSTSSTGAVNVDAVHATTGRVYGSYAGIGGGLTGGSGALLNLPSGDYALRILLNDNTSCQATGSFTIGPAPTPVDPSLSQPSPWQPVGGVLPNPVPLPIEARLTDAGGAARVGLHAEVELLTLAGLAFARFRATVRQASQTVDAAPYLRAELVAAQRYAATSASPLLDADASLAYSYRYRLTDSTGAEPWVVRAGVRYAVLAALPGATDTMRPYVADGTGRVASVFEEGEGAQFLGFPLEVSVLLPPATSTRYAELRYLDAAGQEIEIRSFALASTLPAGMLRIPLPANPLPCTAAVEVSVRSDNRAYAGHCGGVTPAPTSPGYLLTDTGRLLL